MRDLLRRLDRLEWMLMSPLEREICELMQELSEYDPAAVLRVLAEVEESKWNVE